MNTIIKSFLIGSSFFITIFPFMYVGRAHAANPFIQYELVPIFIPIIHGLSNVIGTYLLKDDDENANERLKRFALTGAIAGLTSSLIGTSIGMNERLFSMGKLEAIIMSLIMYPIIYMTVANPIEKIIDTVGK